LPSASFVSDPRSRSLAWIILEHRIAILLAPSQVVKGFAHFIFDFLFRSREVFRKSRRFVADQVVLSASPQFLVEVPIF
jgi:hypothetical protein